MLSAIFLWRVVLSDFPLACSANNTFSKQFMCYCFEAPSVVGRCWRSCVVLGGCEMLFDGLFWLGVGGCFCSGGCGGESVCVCRLGSLRSPRTLTSSGGTDATKSPHRERHTETHTVTHTETQTPSRTQTRISRVSSVGKCPCSTSLHGKNPHDRSLIERKRCPEKRVAEEEL